ncbi:sn-glycerol-1-phosphate dehydrogenase [Streptomyces sp. NP160]|uniref:iron-containing alcohol dehydrogenase n=1 Tax=Streptomyces sp. NP160 TaxID=2586637 RepID=UPI00111AC05B|nr:iron-containing alcohol dehydrogenase [Streptomyces sp. NP160]TNM60711.1 sn-glycerol-1-phosphate dehydrogenase [Streptomyces sp. NP160]
MITSASSLLDLADPTDVDALREALADQDPRRQLTPLGLRRLVVASDASTRVVPELSDLLAARGVQLAGARVVLLVDDVAIQRAGRDLKDDVEAALRAAVGATGAVTRYVVRDEHGDHAVGPLHADETALSAAARAVTGADAVVSVGGGTITDIGKVATSRTGNAPLVVVQTAASVDGFTDDVSVVLASGVKKTIPSRWPDVVLGDLETVAGAPPQMAAAGYGELLSMFTAPADWYLAALTGLDETFHRAPVDLLAVVGRGLAEWSPGVVRGEPEAFEALTRALDVRGIATGVSGGTAVLSGVEHLVSHVLDMHHAALAQPIGLHGAQVGVASVVAAAAWELLFERLAEVGGARAAARLHVDPEAALQRCRDAFGHLDDDGALAAECGRRYELKQAELATRRQRLVAVLERWDEHAEVLRSLVRPSAELREGLRAAGVAATFADLVPSVDAGLARWAVASCHLMRERLVVVDLLDALGWWTPAEVERCLSALEPQEAAL